MKELIQKIESKHPKLYEIFKILICPGMLLVIIRVIILKCFMS